MQKSRQFGAVFLDKADGGPVKMLQFQESLPSWADRRNPGNSNPNQSSKEIMQGWDDGTMRRFEIFMASFEKKKTPWKLEFLDKTMPGWDKQRSDILKCKMELIRRLLIIKVCGPESAEDWVLLFMYHDGQLKLPVDLETLLNPGDSYVTLQEFINTDKITAPVTYDYAFIPPKTNVNYISNMYMPGFGNEKISGTDRNANYVPRYVGKYAFTSQNETEWFNKKFDTFPRFAKHLSPGWSTNAVNSVNPKITTEASKSRNLSSRPVRLSKLVEMKELGQTENEYNALLAGNEYY